MFRKSVLILVLVLPILLPLYFVGDVLLFRHNAEIHRIKIEGYDPRDLLRGHYLMYRFVAEEVKALSVADVVKEKIHKLPQRFFVPEDHALYLEDLLRPPVTGDEDATQEQPIVTSHDMRIGVGVTSGGDVYIEKLYIDGETMEAHLSAHR